MLDPYNPGPSGQLMLNAALELCRRLDQMDFRLREIECRLNLIPIHRGPEPVEADEDDIF